MMAEKGLDFLVAYADDRATFGPAHARWLANFPIHFEPVCILMPRQGAPMMLVGPESDQYALAVAIEAQQTCQKALRPGIEGREIEAIGRRIVAEGNLGQYFLYSGVHSVGVIEFEPPIFGPSSAAKLKENMVISIDIPLFNTPWGGLRIENGYLITANGAEPLHDTPYQIQK
jgi:Xaa-Pro aminopeptidase